MAAAPRRIVRSLVLLLGLLPTISVPKVVARAAAAAAANDDQTTEAGAPPPLLSKFTWFSDLHFDPYYGQPQATMEGPDAKCDSSTTAASPRGQPGCDTPLNLIRMAVQASRDVLPQPDFVLITGDFTRHQTDRLDDPHGTLRYVLSTVGHVLKDTFVNNGVSVVPVLGNNDMTPDYYLDTTQSNNTLLNIAADSFRPLLNSADEERTLRHGGYYSRSIDNGSITIVVLNTIMYSVQHSPPAPSDDPFGQLAWLEGQLLRAQSTNTHVIIAGHIPPSIGSYRQAQFWQDRYLDRYLDLVERYADVVSAQLFGHLHSDEFRVLSSRNGGSSSSSAIPPPPLLLTSSVTPIYGGNPSFRSVSYDAKIGTVVDYDTYYFNLNEEADTSWQRLYTFRESYGVHNMTAPTMRNLVDAMGRDPSSSDSNDVMDKFLSYQRVGAPQPPCDGQCRAEWACVLTSASRVEYEGCISTTTAGRRPSHRYWTARGGTTNGIVLAVVAVGALGVFAVWGMSMMCYRRRIMKYSDIADTFNIDVDEMDDDDHDGVSL